MTPSRFASAAEPPALSLASSLPYLSTDRFRRRELGRRPWRSAKAPAVTSLPPLAVVAKMKSALRLVALDETAERARALRRPGARRCPRHDPGARTSSTRTPPPMRPCLTAIADWAERYTPLVALDAAARPDARHHRRAHLFGGEAALRRRSRRPARRRKASSPARRSPTRPAPPPPPPASARRRRPGRRRGRDARASPARRAPPRSRDRLRAGARRPEAHRPDHGCAARAARRPLRPRSHPPPRSGARTRGRGDQPAPAAARPHRRAPLRRADRAARRTSPRPSPRLPARCARSSRRAGRAPASSSSRSSASTARSAASPSAPAGRSARRSSSASSSARNSPASARRSTPASASTWCACRSSRPLPPIRAQIDLAGDAIGRGRPRPAHRPHRRPPRPGAGQPHRGASRATSPNARCRCRMPENRATENSTPSDLRHPTSDICPLNRPLRLFAQPEPVEAIAEVPDGPPVRFRWRRALYHVARAEGPERIAAEWWRDGSDEPHPRLFPRRGSRPATASGSFARASIGRETTAPRWYLHGVFG